MNAYAVIMAGGGGERLWPLSRGGEPKQFFSLFESKPLIRHAADRLKGLFPAERILVVTAKSFVRRTRKELPELPSANIIAEPCRRNTAPAVALATREVAKRGGNDAVCCILTADHLIKPVGAFQSALRRAIRRAEKGGAIVTLGIKPTFPATGYGYINAASKPIRFTEKPDAKTAAKFLKQGTYYWNSGMFVFRTDTMSAALREFAPEVARLLDARRPLALYPDLKPISIDYAVMEHYDRIQVIPASFRWSDVGTWKSVSEQLPVDRDGNAVIGRAKLIDVRDSLVISDDGHLTAVLGLDNVVVVHTPEATFVCAKDRSEDVRKLLR